MPTLYIQQAPVTNTTTTSSLSTETILSEYLVLPGADITG